MEGRSAANATRADKSVRPTLIGASVTGIDAF
jgi:hypothetical protein